MPGKHRESAVGQIPLGRAQRISSRIKHVLENWFLGICLPGLLIRKKYTSFQRLRQGDRSALELISRLEEIKQKGLVCDLEYIKYLCSLLDREVLALVEALVAFNPIKYALLRNYHRKYSFYVHLALMEEEPRTDPPYVLSLDAELTEDLAGGKAAELSLLRRDHGMPVPPGLVLSTRAFHLLLQRNGLLPRIRSQLRRLGPEHHEDLLQVSRTIRELVLKAEMPPELDQGVKDGLERLGMEKEALALRSSAVGEDMQASFAGQFESQLNVAPDNWFEAYKRVVASKYNPHALYYRMSQGFTDAMTSMAVLFMPTIRATTSGILYTREQNRTGHASTYIVPGCGEKLAAGSEYQARADFHKESRRVRVTDSGLALEPDKLAQVFQLGERLEALFGTPQDVEWLVDEEERIHILQSRPLRMSACEVREEKPDYPQSAVLARGQWASSGQASGRMYRLKDPSSISHIPEQAVVATEELPPELTLVLDRVKAVVAQKGSPACHFASVAREAGVPVLCNAHGAMSLDANSMVSIDSDQGLVLSGGLFQDSSPRSSEERADSPVRKKLADAMESISPLTLREPDSDGFSDQACRSLHDIVRYVHESGVREMFSLVGRRGLDHYGSKRLVSGLPLVMHVLDVHKGLSPDGKSGKEVNLEHIESQPMQRLFAGLGSRAVEWNEAILHYDWDAYAKSSASFVNVEKSTLFSSYAILDQEYLHALLRFGYHFAVIDTVVCDRAEQNYIHFSFKGGGGNQEQRFWRIELIRMILERFLFSVKTTSDLLEATFDRRTFSETEISLSRLGVVLGKTVLLDMRLHDTQQVQSLAEEMLEEIHALFPVPENG
jgi:pyruvate,water dikinase